MNKMNNKRMLWLAALLLTAGSAADSYAQSGIQYPYTTSAGSTSGKTSVIVSRDAAGGVKAACIHANWKASTMPAHNEQDAANAVSARFEVASADLSSLMGADNLINTCGAYTQTGTSAGDWRPPTQRELMLIWVMQKKGLLSGLSFNNAPYWSNTLSFNAGTQKWCIIEFDDGIMDLENISKACYVRCIRDF